VNAFEEIASKLRALETEVNLLKRLEYSKGAGAAAISALTGDVTATGPGSVAATIANDAVTYAKLQNVSATDKLLGRVNAGAGNAEEVTFTDAGQALLDDADAATQRTTLEMDTTYFEWLLSTLFRKRRWLFVDWQCYDYWTSAATGTGSVTIGIHNNSLATGATNGSTAASYATTGAFAMNYAEFAMLGRISTAVTTCDIWAVMTTGTTVGNTTEHMGFNIIDGRVWASNGTGAAGTQTDTGIDLVAATFNTLRLVSDAAVPNIKFYVGGVLVATHTTNLPTYAGHRILFYITNTAAAARTFRVNQVLYHTTADFV
jgi:hypothetical protein